MRNSLSNYLKLAVIAGTFAAGSLTVASPAQAGIYSNFADAVQHYIECANWLVSDPAKHAQFCSPGHDVFVSGSTGFAAAPKCYELPSGDFVALTVVEPCDY
jgi:hypothetical protein